jgi:cytochrome c551/c552
MGTVQKLLVSPNAQNFDLLPWIAQMVQLIYLPFIGVLLISSLLSLAHRRDKHGFSTAFLGLVPPWPLGFVAGILTYACLPFLYGQIWFGLELRIGSWLESVFCVSVVGQVLLYMYWRTGRFTLGAFGHITLGVACLAHFYFISYLADPSLWVPGQGKLSLIHYPHWITTFAQFVLASAVVTGGAILWLLLDWSKESRDKVQAQLLRKWGLGLSFVGSFLWPVVLVADVFIIPEPALRTQTFILGAIGLAALAVVATITAVAILRGSNVCAKSVFAMGFVAFTVFGLNTLNAQVTANAEFRSRLSRTVHEQRDEQESAQAKFYKRVAISSDGGRKVFESRCTSCHGWDNRIVGPPLKQVLGKYVGKQAELRDYIRKPRKIDPSYPVMPNLGLSVVEAESVAAYLLEESKKK